MVASLDVNKACVRGGRVADKWIGGVGCGGGSLQKKVPMVKQRARGRCHLTLRDSLMIRFVSFCSSLTPLWF